MAVKSDRARDQLDPGPRKIVRGADAVTESAAASENRAASAAERVAKSAHKRA